MKKDLKLIWSLIGRYWWRYVLGLGSLLAVDWLISLMPQIPGLITDGLKEGTMDMDGVWRQSLRFLALGGVVTLGRFGWRFFLFGSGRLVERDLRNRMFGHLETLSARYFNSHKTGDLMAHFTNDLNSVRQLVGMTVVTTFDATVMLIMVLVNMISFVSWKLTLIALIPMVLIIIGDIFFGKAMHRRFLARQEAFSKLSDHAQESISGIRVIKAFVQEKREQAAFALACGEAREKNLAVVRLMALVFPLLGLVIGVSILLTLIYGGWLAITGELTAGQFVTFNTYIGMLVWPMIAAGECVSSVSQGLASLRRIRDILDQKPDIVDRGDPSITALSGQIDVSGLTFTYPDSGETPALRDVSVSVKAGETLAVIGRTGAGKTTLISLLERLWDTEKPDMIRMDGHDLRDIPLSVLRRDIAYVPQDNFLFSDTVENNILFGVENGTHEQAVEAAKTACVHDNIMDFPDGYDTLLGERGVTISGGQKQRVSIARALMKDAPILILDDSLSAVDTDTEEQILRSLRENRKGRTTLIVAHRISTIQHADHILVLEDGARAEYGTHDELMALQGLYYGIFQKQQLERQLHEEGGEEA